MNPYEDLANAIIMQAVRDYRKTQYEGTHIEIEAFFKSEWFKVLSAADGILIMKKLRRELEQ